MDSTSGEDFLNDPRVIRFQTIVMEATDKLDEYLLLMSKAYDSAIQLSEGEVIDAQETYRKVVEGHVNRMHSKLAQP